MKVKELFKKLNANSYNKRVSSNDSNNSNNNNSKNYEKCYYSLIEQATDPIFLVDLNGNLKEVNSSLCALSGYGKAELLHVNIKTLLDVRHLNEMPVCFDQLSVGEKSFMEWKMVHKNGTIIYVEANSKRSRDNSVLVIIKDITDREKGDEVLMKSEANLQTIFDTTDTIYVSIDNDFRIISFNPRARYFAKNELGHDFEISEYILDYFPEERKRVLRTYMNEALNGTRINYEIDYPQPDDSVNYYHVRMFPISKDDQSIYGLVLAVSDITDKKVMEQKLLAQKVQEQKRISKAIADAQEKERAELGRELHDNILQLLSTSVMYAAHSLCHPEDYKEFIIKTKEHTEAAILALRKLSHALVGPTHDASMGLIDALEELTSNISVLKGIKVIFSYCTFKEDQYGVGLKLVIYRIIQEQLNNILKHSEASEIYIELIKDSANLTVIITDNGKGFDTFVRKSGIGLKNIMHRAEMHNGVVHILSSPGNGCRMKVIFPLNNL